MSLEPPKNTEGISTKLVKVDSDGEIETFTYLSRSTVYSVSPKHVFDYKVFTENDEVTIKP